MTEEYSMDSVAIRRATGLSQDYIERLQWVNRAAPDVQRALDDEEISLGHAAAIARVERHDVQQRILDACLVNRMTVDGLKHHIQMVEEILANPTAASEPAPAPAPRLASCHLCREPYPPDQLTLYPLCPACYGATWQRTRPTT